MHEPDFWTNQAEAMEMSIEGNRLIAQEIADLARNLWHRAVHSFDGLVRRSGQYHQLPPVSIRIQAQTP